MGLFTLEDLEVALGRDITEEETPYYQYLIDAISLYIENVTGTAFSLKSNETVRYRADGRGIIELTGPVVEIFSVNTVAPDLYYSGYTYGWMFDGISELYYLEPYEVVDVTYTYGYVTVPSDIKAIAIEATKNVIAGFDETDLDTKTVGDITYKYRFGSGDFNSLQQSTLDSYRGVAESWRL